MFRKGVFVSFHFIVHMCKIFLSYIWYICYIKIKVRCLNLQLRQATDRSLYRGWLLADDQHQTIIVLAYIFDDVCFCSKSQLSAIHF